jgi:hypothetical protein
LGLSFVSGINLYATVLVVGLGIRYHWVTGLPSELAILAHPVVIALAGALYALEFLADKIPLVSTLWDGLHTFVRPVGGALLAVASASGLDPMLQVVAFMVGGSVALGTHSTKMGFRVLAHKYPNPVAHSIISVSEDLGVVALLALAYSHPLIGLCLLLCLIVLMAWLAPLLFRTIIFVLRGVAGRMIFWHPGLTRPPTWLDRKLPVSADVNALRVYLCFARTVRGVSRLKKGYLVVSAHEAFFACRGLVRSKMLPVGGTIAGELDVDEGLIFDVLTFINPSGGRTAIYFTKECSRQFRSHNPTARSAECAIVQPSSRRPTP